MTLVAAADQKDVFGNKQSGRLSIKIFFIEGTYNEINKFYEVERGACCCQEVRPFPVFYVFLRKYRTW